MEAIKAMIVPTLGTLILLVIGANGFTAAAKFSEAVASSVLIVASFEVAKAEPLELRCYQYAHGCFWPNNQDANDRVHRAVSLQYDEMKISEIFAEGDATYCDTIDQGELDLFAVQVRDATARVANGRDD
ncbi:hypothetical protein Nepgr_029699 [Nepenthes gracilis]|uniref:Uncharacterized protein n=1 Tax=Nepenthes gracilis TaxID=150966 RepID=A0AAD3Y5S3_NEPGR|nr:hypothetical protein Nepgr_029699 [Nepenthes gracilis]